MRPRALIVDDSLTVRMDIGEALEAAGFEVVLCSDVKSARRALAAQMPSIAVLDVVLPDGDGVELLRELRSAPGRARLPVLLLSSEAEVKSRVRGIDAGADEYVGKPYDIGQVVARARALALPVPGAAAPGGRRVLIIDDSATFRDGLRQSLEAAGYEVHEASSGEEGLSLAAAVRPDAAVVDGMLPGIDGPTVVRRIKSDAALRAIPCILLTAAEGPGAEVASLDAGADAHVRKSEDLDLILVRLAALLRRSTPPQDASPSMLGPKRLLAVDDSATYLHELGAQLREEGYDAVLAQSGEEALALLAAQPVDCILLDLVMPGLSGQETCRRIKEAPQWRQIPLVMLTAREDRDAMIEGINSGADDYISKSADFEVLKARLRAQLRRKHFEDENRRIREKLVQRESEARFQRLLQSDIIGVLQGSLGAGVTEANEAFLKMTGHSRAELESGALRWSVLAPAEARERLEAALALLRERGKADPFQTELLRKGGTRLPIMLGLVLLEGADTVVGFVVDRTEQERAEAQARQYARALEAANREMESFSYSVAHDLRAPLRAIDGFSQALLDDYGEKLEEEGKQNLRFVRKGAQRMAQLIDDLLALSRVSRSELRSEAVDLSALAKASLARLQAANPDRSVAVVVEEGLNARADSRLLGIAFDNLLGNAWKFTARREGARIEFGAGTREGQRAYFVRDNGAGFDMRYAEKLFGVFQRLHTHDQFEGTGIGLATVQRIVSRHGGRVWAEGAVGQGATFYFTLA